MKATLIQSGLPDMTGRANLYRCEPPMEGHEYVVVSAVVAYSGPETYIFPADESGTVTDWGELPGPYRGGMDHDSALERAGYQTA